MNKTLMLAAFAVLLTGFAFAIAGVDVTPGTDTKFNGSNADSDITEGGNVTELNLSGNVSTEKWAGYFGDLVGNIVLAQALDTAYMFNWTWDGDNATVCASTAPAFTWASVVGGTAADLTTPWPDSAVGSDTSALTYAVAAKTVYIDGADVTGEAADTNGDFFTVVVNNGATAAKSDLAFCVGAGDDYGTTNYKGGSSNYEMIVPTDVGDATVFETYYFYFELH